MDKNPKSLELSVAKFPFKNTADGTDIKFVGYLKRENKFETYSGFSSNELIKDLMNRNGLRPGEHIVLKRKEFPYMKTLHPPMESLKESEYDKLEKLIAEYNIRINTSEPTTPQFSLSN